MELTKLLPAVEDTQGFAQKLSGLIRMPCVVYLEGDLGAGKTTFAQRLLRALGITSNIPSPTYTILERYMPAIGTVYHLDLYRLGSAEELEYLGIRDVIGQSIVLIEWPSKGGIFAPPPDISLHFTIEAEGRGVRACSHSTLGESILAGMASA